MTAETGLRETDRLAGDISQRLFDEFCSATRLHLGGQEYELVGTDELGLPDDPWGDPIVRRKNDGKLFEVEIEVFAREFTPPKPADPDGPQEIPGQEPLPGVTG